MGRSWPIRNTRERRQRAAKAAPPGPIAMRNDAPKLATANIKVRSLKKLKDAALHARRTSCTGIALTRAHERPSREVIAPCSDPAYSAAARNAACTARTRDGCSTPSLGVWPWGAAGGTENHSVLYGRSNTCLRSNLVS